MGNHTNWTYAFPTTHKPAIKKILASGLLLSTLAAFTAPVLAQESAKQEVAKPTNKADDIIEALRRALILKKTQAKPEASPAPAPKADEQASKTDNKEARKADKKADKMPQARFDRLSKKGSPDIFFATARADYFSFKAQGSSGTELKYNIASPRVGFGWTHILNKRWGITSELGARFYSKAKTGMIANDRTTKSYGLSLMASYLISDASIFHFGVAREDELYTMFARSGVQESIQLETEAVNKVKLGWSYVLNRYAKGKNGFSLNLEALSSGDNLKSTVRYGASYFLDFAIDKSSALKLKFNLDHAKKEDKTTQDIKETKFGTELGYYF